MGNSAAKIEKKLETAPLAVIVGGGFAGISTARALEASCNVIVIEKQNFFFQNLGMLPLVYVI